MPFLHIAFELNAKLYLDKVALIFEGQYITYEQLNCAANNLATSLSNAGVRFGDVVPILLNKTPELIVSIIAVLKIGAIYTLVDINLNKQKIKSLLNFLTPSLLITKDNFFACTTNVWKTFFPRIDYNHAKNFIVSLNMSENCAACIFFTSGSTGKPNAVLSSHKATMRLFIDKSILNFSNKSIIPLAAAIPWDAFSLELWGALANGGTLWIIDDLHLTSVLLRKGILLYNVNTVWLTSSLFNSIVEEDIKSFKGLEYVITGGERLSVHHVKAFLLYHHNKIELINGYGPVESTIFTTIHKINIEDCNNYNGIPIGCVVPQTEVFILNKNYNTCVDNEVGEIGIAGDGLAINYFNNQKLTNEKFKTIKLNGQEKRIYCSGDLGFFKNRILHYYNRKDRQVKILGHRIDLGTVERKIERLVDSIASCRLLVRRDSFNISNEIVAFYTPKSGKSLDSAYLIKTINETLETYECPKAINQIENFPLTYRGKIDDAALLNILSSIEKNSAITLSTLCNNKFENNLLKIFFSVTRKVFKDEATTFQRLGISSIDIGRICTRLNKFLGLQIPMSVMYKYNTIESLSNYLTTERNNGPKRVNLDDLRDTQILYLTKYLMNPSIPIYYCLMIWKITGDLDIEKLQNAINHAHVKNTALRSIYSLEESISNMPTYSIDCPQILHLPASSSEKQAILFLKKTLSKGLNPICGIIWKTAIVSLKNTKVNFLGCVIHHVAFDGYSEHLLAQSISNGYNAKNNINNATSLSTPIIFRNSPIKNDSNTNTSEGLDSISKKLSKCVKIKWSDQDSSKNSNTHYCRSFILNQSLILSIDDFASKNNTTRFNILLHYWAMTLYRLVINKNFCIAVPIRQRNIPTLKKIIGCYINIIYICFDSDHFSHDDYYSLQHTNSAIRRAMLTQDIPSIQIIQKMQTYSYDITNMSQVLFALQDNPIPKLQLENLQADFLRQSYFNIPFELHAEIWPTSHSFLELMISYKTIIPTGLIDKIGKHFIKYLNYLKVE